MKQENVCVSEGRKEGSKEKGVLPLAVEPSLVFQLDPGLTSEVGHLSPKNMHHPAPLHQPPSVALRIHFTASLLSC